MLKDDIEALVSAGASADRTAAREAYARLRVNAWVKQGILIGVRFGDTVDMSLNDDRPWPFFDKDTLPLRRFGGAADGVRIVPGGSSVRDGAFIAPGVICMP